MFAPARRCIKIDSIRAHQLYRRCNTTGFHDAIRVRSSKPKHSLPPHLNIQKLSLGSSLWLYDGALLHHDTLAIYCERVIYRVHTRSCRKPRFKLEVLYTQLSTFCPQMICLLAIFVSDQSFIIDDAKLSWGLKDWWQSLLRKQFKQRKGVTVILFIHYCMCFVLSVCRSNVPIYKNLLRVFKHSLQEWHNGCKKINDHSINVECIHQFTSK